MFRGGLLIEVRGALGGWSLGLNLLKGTVTPVLNVSSPLGWVPKLIIDLCTETTSL